MSKLAFGLLFLVTSLLAAPTPPSIEELIANSDYIAKSKLTGLKEKQISKNTISVHANSEILKVYKAKDKMPPKLDLAFTILPEVFGKWLKASPKEGEYVLFYISKEIKDSSGKKKAIITLYEPHIFAFREWSEELEKTITQSVK